MGRIGTVYKKFEQVVEEFADKAAAFAAHPLFLVTHILWFILWIIMDVEDFPFGLLTMIVSLEAIILSSLILSSTNREAERDRQTLIRSVNHAKETHDILDDIHDDIQEIKDILEEDEVSLDEIIYDANQYNRRRADRYFTARTPEPEPDYED